MNTFPRWLTAALVLSVAVILGAGAWFYRNHEHTMQLEVARNLEAVALLKVNQIAAWRAERLAGAAVIAESPFFIQVVARYLADPDDETATAILTRFGSRKHYHYRDVLLVDVNGQVRLSLTGQLGPLDEEAGRTLADACRDRKPVFTDIHLDAQDRPHIGVVAPILTGEGESAQPVGAVILISDVQQFLYPLIQSWPGPESTAETLIVRRDGDAVLFLNELRHQPGAALRLRLPLTRTDVPAVMAVLGREGVVQGLDYRGVEVLSVLKVVPDSPWFMVAKVDKSEALAGWHFQAVLILALFLTLTAFAAAAVFVFWQRNAKVHYRTMLGAETAWRKSEMRFHTTLMSVGDGIIATDAQGLVEFLNPVAEVLTGWPEEEARNRPLEEVFHIVNEETREEVENPIARVLREGLVVGLANHTLLIARDGKERPIADSGAPIRDEKGAVTGVVLVFRDQTEERAVQKALRESEEKYRTILEEIEDGYYEIDIAGNFTFCNDQFCRLFGYSRDEIISKNFRRYTNEEEAGKLYRVFNEVYRTGAPVKGFACDLVVKDGIKKHLEFSISQIKNESGQSIGFRGITRDITERKEAEQALRESEERFRRALENIPDVVVIYGPDLRIRYINAAPFRVTGRPASDFIGKRDEEIWPAEACQTYLPTLQDALHTRKIRFLETDLLLPEAGLRKLTITCVPMLDERGEVREILSVVHDFTRRKEAEEALRRWADMASFLADFSARCINLPVSETDAAVNQALEGIGALTGSDRSYVFLLDEEKETVDNTHEWCAPGIEPQRENIQGLPWDTIPWWMAGLWRFETIYIPRVAEMPPEAAAEKKILEDQNIRSLLVVPISWQQKLKGFLGFDSVQRERVWTGEDRQVLETLANTLAMVFEHQRAEAEREKLQTQLLQAQKMEAVGRLAGGVAHDFNNMLQVILGRTEMALSEIDQESSLYEGLTEIQKAAEHSADLTRQLLAFARKQTVHPQVLDLNDTVSGMLKMLRRLIGEDIDLGWLPGLGLWKVRMDPSQIDQILANLMVNARDAIGGVGRVTIGTENVVFDEAYCADHAGFIPGEYVLLAVSDDGRGMDKEILVNIFEPFFTTKGLGEGTGLGLATVYGIVKQNEGFINVYSEPDLGTTFRIYLPRFADEAVEVPVAKAVGTLPEGTETVLLVEDEETILNLGKTMLKGLGYTVLTAGTPGRAIHLAEKHPGAIDLLITDVVMPEMNGRDLAGQLVSIRPTMKCLYMSGYTANLIVHRGVLDEGVQFIQKPFSMSDLAEKVREVLDQG